MFQAHIQSQSVSFFPSDAIYIINQDVRILLNLSYQNVCTVILTNKLFNSTRSQTVLNQFRVCFTVVNVVFKRVNDLLSSAFRNTTNSAKRLDITILDNLIRIFECFIKNLKLMVGQDIMEKAFLFFRVSNLLKLIHVDNFILITKLFMMNIFTTERISFIHIEARNVTF